MELDLFEFLPSLCLCVSHRHRRHLKQVTRLYARCNRMVLVLPYRNLQALSGVDSTSPDYCQHVLDSYVNHNPKNFPCIGLQLVGIQTEIPILRIWELPRLCAQPGDSVLLTMITANESHNVTPRSLCRAEHGFYHIISHPAPTFGVLEPGPCSISLPNIQLLTCWDHARVIRENILVISPHVFGSSQSAYM